MLDWIANNWVYVAGAGILLFAATALLYATVLFRRAAKDLRRLDESIRERLFEARESKLLFSEELASELQERVVERAYSVGYERVVREAQGKIVERIYSEGYERVVEQVADLGRRAVADVGRELAGRVDKLTERLSEELSSAANERRAETFYLKVHKRVAEQVEDLYLRAFADVSHKLAVRVEELKYWEGQQLRDLFEEVRISLLQEIQAEVKDLRRTILRGYTMPAEIVISGIAAALQAVQTWLSLRDRSKAARVFDETFAQRRDAPDTREQAEILITLVPPSVLTTMEKRTRSCWEKYHDVLKDEREFLPEEVDNATEALKRCICRELSRIRKLNRDTLPPGDLSNWWSSYCKTLNA